MRERRLRDVELLGRAGEVPVPRDRLDVSELAKLHRGSIVNHDRSGDNNILLRSRPQAIIRSWRNRLDSNQDQRSHRRAAWERPVTLRLAGGRRRRRARATRPAGLAAPSLRPSPAWPSATAGSRRRSRWPPPRSSPIRSGAPPSSASCSAATPAGVRVRPERSPAAPLRSATEAGDRVSEATVRDEFRPGDLDAIVAHHRRVYGEEYGVDSRFGDFVAAAVARAAERGFPTRARDDPDRRARRRARRLDRPQRRGRRRGGDPLGRPQPRGQGQRARAGGCSARCSPSPRSRATAGSGSRPSASSRPPPTSTASTASSSPQPTPPRAGDGTRSPSSATSSSSRPRARLSA